MLIQSYFWCFSVKIFSISVSIYSEKIELGISSVTVISRFYDAELLTCMPCI